MVVSIIIISTWSAFLFFAKADTDNERLGCERLNVVRGEVFNIIVDTLDRSEQLVQAPGSPEEIKIRKLAVKQYSKTKEKLLESTEDLVDEPGSVIVNCDKAYPYPWSF